VTCMGVRVVGEAVVSGLLGTCVGQSLGFASGVRGAKIYHIQALLDIFTHGVMIHMNPGKTSSIQIAKPRWFVMLAVVAVGVIRAGIGD
jgi:hypothetical protein